MADQFGTDQAKQVIENGMSQAQELISDPSKIQELLGQLGDFVKNLPGEATGALGNIPLMASMVKDYVTKEYTEVSPKVIATLVAAFLYLVKRNDLIPDNVPLLGLVDDVAVVALALKLDEAELAAYKAWKDERGEIIDAEVLEGSAEA